MSDLLKVKVGGSSYLCKWEPSAVFLHTLCNKCENDKDIPLVGPISNALPAGYSFNNPTYTFTENATYTNVYDIRDKEKKLVIVDFQFVRFQSTCSFSLPFGRIEYHDYNDMVSQIRNKIVFRILSNVDILYSDFLHVREGSSIHFIIPDAITNRYKIEATQDGDELTIKQGSLKAIIKYDMSQRNPCLGMFNYNIKGSNSSFILNELLISSKNN